MKNRFLEICAYNIQSCFAAAEAGASRIELCSSPAEGGVTPGYGTIQYAIENISIPVYVMIRPRGGNFIYDTAELSIIYKDIFKCRQIGCPGIVTGILNQDGNIDTEEMKKIVELSYPMGVTFHKAFDTISDPFAALEQLIDAGCERVLTSGLQPTATEGAGLLADLVAAAGERIIVMPGGGVRSANITTLEEVTKAKEFHSSALVPGDTSGIANIDEVMNMVRTL